MAGSQDSTLLCPPQCLRLSYSTEVLLIVGSICHYKENEQIVNVSRFTPRKNMHLFGAGSHHFKGDTHLAYAIPATGIYIIHGVAMNIGMQ